MIDNITIRKTVVTVAALASFGLGGAAIAGATGDDNRPQDRPAREALSTDVAAKVKAAALEKVPGATVLRTEAGGPYGTPYHAHIRTWDGTRQVVRFRPLPLPGTLRLRGAWANGMACREG